VDIESKPGCNKGNIGLRKNENDTTLPPKVSETEGEFSESAPGGAGTSWFPPALEAIASEEFHPLVLGEKSTTDITLLPRRGHAREWNGFCDHSQIGLLVICPSATIARASLGWSLTIDGDRVGRGRSSRWGGSRRDITKTAPRWNSRSSSSQKSVSSFPSSQALQVRVLSKVSYELPPSNSTPPSGRRPTPNPTVSSRSDSVQDLYLKKPHHLQNSSASLTANDRVGSIKELSASTPPTHPPRFGTRPVRCHRTSCSHHRRRPRCSRSDRHRRVPSSLAGIPKDEAHH